MSRQLHISGHGTHAQQCPIRCITSHRPRRCREVLDKMEMEKNVDRSRARMGQAVVVGRGHEIKRNGWMEVDGARWNSMKWDR
jgi:hypothetical protein